MTRRFAAALVVVSCAAICAVLVRGFAVYIYDADVFMHLRTGQWIAEHRSVPRSDPFSATASGRDWIDHEWLWQLIAHQVYRLGGYRGISIARIGCIVGALAFCIFSARLRKVSWHAVLPAAALLICPLVPFAEIRPHTTTFLFVGFLLWLLEMSRTAPKMAAFLPLIFLVWANMHGAFIIGFVLAACVVIGWICEAHQAARQRAAQRGGKSNGFRKRLTESLLVRPILYVSLFCAGALIVTLLNPYGIHTLTFSSRVLGHALFRSRIYEWAPPDWSRPFVPFYASAAVVVVAAFMGRRNLRAQDWLLLLLFGFLALRMRRQIAFFSLVMIPTFAAALDASMRRESKRLREAAFAIACLLLFLWPAGAYYCFRKIHPPLGTGPAPGRFPIGAAAKLAGLSGGVLLNDYNDGGFLIHQLFPQWRVTMDGRADIYGPRLAKRYAKTWAGAPDWSSALKAWNVSAILGRYEIPRSLPQHNLYHELGKTNDWQLVYWDDVSLLYLRSDKVAASGMEPYRNIQPALLPRGRPTVLTEEKRKALLPDIERALRENPSSRMARSWLSLLRGTRM